MSGHTVVVNDCEAVAVVGGPVAVRTRDTAVGTRNFQFNYSHLAEGLPRQLTEREMDWIETLGSIFALDLACPRGGGDMAWARNIEAHLPVRDPDYWNANKSRIQALFADLTEDRLELHFHEDEEPADAPRQRRRPFPEHDCVSLLSGGVDSFVGTADLLSSGRRPLMVSHTAAGAISHAQTVVEAFYSNRYDDLERIGVTARKHGGTFPTPPEPSQRSRSLLFLGAATLVAAVGESGEVFINENGIMAIHVPMTAARAGSLSTHTASPVVMERVEALASDVLGQPLAISNGLVHMTKPEVVGHAKDLGVDGALRETVSCWAIGRTGVHCGICAPCLMRRISFEIHGAADAAYTDDIFEDESVLDNDFACDNLTHMLRLIQDVDRDSDTALQVRYPELLNGGRDLDLTTTLEMHRRWAQEANGLLLQKPVPRMLI